MLYILHKWITPHENAVCLLSCQMDELSLAGEEFLRVMVLDALPTSHAVQQEITDISAILNNFDLTSYYKVSE